MKPNRARMSQNQARSDRRGRTASRIGSPYRRGGPAIQGALGSDAFQSCGCPMGPHMCKWPYHQVGVAPLRAGGQNTQVQNKESIMIAKSRINKNTQVYLVDTYGEAKKFLNLSSIVFLP